MCHRLADTEAATVFGAISDVAANALIAKKADRGIEMYNFFWVSPKLKAHPILGKCLVLHNIKEYANLAKILPGVYAEKKITGRNRVSGLRENNLKDIGLD